MTIILMLYQINKIYRISTKFKRTKMNKIYNINSKITKVKPRFNLKKINNKITN